MKLVGWFLTLLTLTTPNASADDAPLRFNRDIRPILADACLKCHGPDAMARQGDLRLDTREGLFTRRDSGPPVVPSNPQASVVIQRLTHADPAERMPPPDSGKSLTIAQIELLTKWVAQGAVWENHWAFIPPERPAAPFVRHGEWSRTAIDDFIVATLEQRGWTPQAAASPETLIRRVTFDLTGLPPTPEEIDDYLADSSPDCYDRLVDRLLAAPRFGEHAAVDWLDAARYADTSGYQNDGPRDMWRWRDWVIAAFNANLPFDQFTREQLAGDLLINSQEPAAPGRDSSSPLLALRAAVTTELLKQPRGYLPRDPRAIDLLIATGFQRNHRGNSEGGIIPEEYAVEYVADRVDTFGAVWLGLTVGCARCHSHKYDPIAQTDYYRLFAYFNQVPEYGRCIKEGNSPPYITAPTAAQWLELQRLEAELSVARSTWDRLQSELQQAERAWEKCVPDASERPGHWRGATDEWTITEGLLARFPLNGNLSDATRPQQSAQMNGGDSHFIAGPSTQALHLDGTQFLDAGDVAKFSYFDEFSATAWINPAEPLSGGIVTRTSDDAYADGWTYQLENGHLQVNLVKRWLDDAIRVETNATLVPGRWQHVAMTYDGSRTADGIAIFIDGELQPLIVHYDFLNQSFTNDEPLRIGSTGTKHRLTGALADVRVYRRALSANDASLLATRETIPQIAAIPPERRTPGQAHKLREYFLQHAAPSHIAAASQRLQTAEAAHQQFLKSLPTAMVMVDQATPRPTYVLKRGVYDQPGDQVQPGVPAALPVSVPQPSALSPQPLPDRLALADWLLDPRQPLTARVAVNRIWQRLFGTGLVKTSEDFGTQGEPPSHPELLDWLALDLIRSGWDVKRIHRAIVTSAAYRQSSRVSPGQLQADPENRLLARGPRFRLSAEMVRDQALFASGLLEERLGGPSVKPYQPPGLWQEIATDTQYEPSPAPDVYRRSLYCYTKRTVANPTMTLFDGPTRESCTLRRSRTSTPLQALTLWNDITFVEAARVLAERSLQATPKATIRTLFRRVVGREPQADELARLTDSWKAYRKQFDDDPKAVRSLMAVGSAASGETQSPADVAAYAAIASVLFNLDEVVTKE